MSGTTKDLTIEIEARTKGAEADINRLTSQIKKLQKQSGNFKETTKQVNQMSRSFASLAIHLGKLATIYGIFEGLNTSIRTFADFEQSITRLGVISGATTSELEALRAKALELGSSTQFSASQVADGLNAMAMAGLSVQQQLDGIEGVLNLAIVGMLDLGDASLIAVKTMNGFNLKAKDISLISDVMAVAISDSAQSTTELGNAYEKVAPVAHSFGLSIQESTSALEVLADAGRTGSEAGTQLKIILSRLAGNKEALKYIQQLGVSMYDATGKLKPFKEQLSLLRDKLSKLDEQSRNLKLSQIFGEEGKSSAILLLDNLDKYDNKLKTVRHSFGKAQEDANKLKDTLQGSYKELISALQNLSIEIGDSLSPALRKIISDSTDFINSLSPEDINAFGDSVADTLILMEDLGSMLIQVVGAVSSVALAFKDATGFSSAWIIPLGLLIKNFGKITTAMLSMNPVILAMGLAIEGVALALESYELEVQRSMKATDKYIDVSRRLQTVLLDVKRDSGSFNTTEITAYLKYIDTGIRDAKKSIVEYQEIIKNLNSGWVSDEDKSQIQAYSGAIRALKVEIKNATSAKKILTEQGNKLANALEIETKATDANARAKKQLSLATQKLSADDEKLLAKSKASLKSREKGLDSTLATMLKKERTYKDNIAKIEDNIAKIRASYANKRVSANIDSNSRIFQLQTSGFNDYGKYLANQKRADELYNLAKENLAKKNLVLARKYLNESTALSEKGAGEQIKVGNRVFLNKRQTANEGIRDAQKANKLTIALLNAEEQKTIEVENKKKAKAKVELDSLKVQIELQRIMISLVEALIEKTTGIKFHIDMSGYEKALKDVDSDLEVLNKKKLYIKGTGDFKNFNTKYNAVKNKVEKTKVPVKLDLDNKEVFKKFEVTKDGLTKDVITGKYVLSTDLSAYEKSKNKIESEPITSNFNLKTDTAESKLHTFKIKSEATEVTPKLSLNTEKASSDLANISVKGSQTKVEPKVELNTYSVNKDVAQVSDTVSKANVSPKVKLNTSSVSNDVAKLQTKLKSDKVEVPLDVSTALATATIIKFKNNIKDESIIAMLNLNKKLAEDAFSVFKKDVNDSVVNSSLLLNVDSATKMLNMFRQFAQKPMHTTLYVNTVYLNQRRKLGGLIHDMPKFQNGGHLENGLNHKRRSGKLGGYGGGDKVKALLEAGEFIIRKEAVKSLGIDRLSVINQGKIPKFQTGGFVSPIQKFQTGGAVSSNVSTASNSSVDLNINMGGSSFKATTTPDVATDLAEYLDRRGF